MSWDSKRHNHKRCFTSLIFENASVLGGERAGSSLFACARGPRPACLGMCALFFSPSPPVYSFLHACAIAAQQDRSKAVHNLRPRPWLPTTSALIGSSSQLHIKSAKVGEGEIWRERTDERRMLSCDWLKTLILTHRFHNFLYSYIATFITLKKLLPVASVVTMQHRGSVPAKVKWGTTLKRAINTKISI